MSAQRPSLFVEVVDRGFCIGCGVCAVDQPDLLTMALSQEGLWQPVLRDAGPPVSSSVDARLLQLCPFADGGPHEDALAAALYPDLPEHPVQGRQGVSMAGWVLNEPTRVASSSGGLTTWLLAELLRTGAVDAVVHVAEMSEGSTARYGMVVSKTPDEVESRRKTRYYPVTYADVGGALRGLEGKVAVVGVPCFVKAVRRLAAVDPGVDAAVTVTVALICGHLKTTQWHDYLIAAMGEQLSTTVTLDFRAKLEDRPANRYGVTRSDADGTRRTVAVGDLPLTSWDLGLFKPRACDFCEDVMGETADVTIGDAWLPRFVPDWRGANVVLVRSPLVTALLEQGVLRGELHLEPLAAGELAASQASSLKHRREGLAVRLGAARAAGIRVPKKRVRPSLSWWTRDGRVALSRYALAQRSRRLFPPGGGPAEAQALQARLRLSTRVHGYLQMHLRKGVRDALARRRSSER